MEWRTVMNNKNLIFMCIDCNKNRKCERDTCKWDHSCKIFYNVFHFYPYYLFYYNAEDILIYLLKKGKD